MGPGRTVTRGSALTRALRRGVMPGVVRARVRHRARSSGGSAAVRRVLVGRVGALQAHRGPEDSADEDSAAVRADQPRRRGR
jgi:hypothetical protein